MKPIVPVLSIGAVCVLLTTHAHAAVIQFSTDPFAGTTARTTPGRQVVGNELFTTFDIAHDVFSFDPAVFGITGGLQFANTVAASLPAVGVNVVVLETFDNDNNLGTPFGAGNAAALIADQLTAPGPGFFIYFNQGLDLARLVYSTDLSDSTADLKILARMLNLSGQAGRDALPLITAANFQLATVPDTAGNMIPLLVLGSLVAGQRIAARRTARL